jgi:adenylate cyclase class 2
MRRMQGSTREVEVKLPFRSAAEARERLESLGAEESTPRQFEDNVVFDRDDLALKRAGLLLRLRTRGDRAVLTVKTPVKGERRYKVRGEDQTTVGDAGATARLLRHLGFTPYWRYQKYRTKYALGDLTICLDETPIGCYVELEGPPEQIDRAAARLGFTPDQYVCDTYRTLQEREAARRGEPVGDLLLDPAPDAPTR